MDKNKVTKTPKSTMNKKTKPSYLEIAKRPAIKSTKIQTNANKAKNVMKE